MSTVRASAPPVRRLAEADPASADVVWLDEDRAQDSELTGAKAANLARARQRGLPILGGFAITTAATAGGTVPPRSVERVREAWRSLSDGGALALVVRSSSTVEDSTTSSLAGQFTSVQDVRGWQPFLDAIAVVLASAAHPHDAASRARPMAVLVQPMLEAECSGVLFGLDPVTGDRRHVIVEALPGSPEPLVSGTVTAAHYALGRHGRLLGRATSTQQALLGASRRRRLARLARQVATAFGAPQDVEWAFDAGDRLWLLQARAVTASGPAGRPAGPILGPGPVAETFPDPLRPLEADLWVEPLRTGVIGALYVTGAVGRRRIRSSPVVTTIGGRVAADLELFGIAPRGGLRHALNPVPGARRLVAAWRVGRLRAALPSLAADLVASVDDELQAVEDLTRLDDRSLLELLERTGPLLASVHGYEVLAGMLLDDDQDGRGSLAAAAIDVLSQGWSDGLSDEELIAHTPLVLALVPPAVGPLPTLPSVAPGSPPDELRGRAELGCREQLRLRCRWMQELGARASWELGLRLTSSGVLGRREDVRELDLSEMRVAVDEGRVPPDLRDRRERRAGAPLPMAFRLAADAIPVAVAMGGSGADGLAASAGRGRGVVCHEPVARPTDEPCVLIVDTLDPRLAAALPGLAGLVSETGSALSHLAILAREKHVPTVVAVADARRRFPVGAYVLVDGSTGEVTIDAAEEAS